VDKDVYNYWKIGTTFGLNLLKMMNFPKLEKERLMMKRV